MGIFTINHFIDVYDGDLTIFMTSGWAIYYYNVYHGDFHKPYE
jgi:hypothetical protein